MKEFIKRNHDQIGLCLIIIGVLCLFLICLFVKAHGVAVAIGGLILVLIGIAFLALDELTDFFERHKK